MQAKTILKKPHTNRYSGKNRGARKKHNRSLDTDIDVSVDIYYLVILSYKDPYYTVSHHLQPTHTRNSSTYSLTTTTFTYPPSSTSHPYPCGTPGQCPFSVSSETRGTVQLVAILNSEALSEGHRHFFTPELFWPKGPRYQALPLCTKPWQREEWNRKVIVSGTKYPALSEPRADRRYRPTTESVHSMELWARQWAFGNHPYISNINLCLNNASWLHKNGLCPCKVIVFKL